VGLALEFLGTRVRLLDQILHASIGHFDRRIRREVFLASPLASEWVITGMTLAPVAFFWRADVWILSHKRLLIMVTRCECRTILLG
jgi:hypothetical protein